MATTRLSALDAAFLAVETPTAHMHVGWASVYDPPAQGPRPGFDELRDHIGSRFGRAPRYRQLLRRVPLGIKRGRGIRPDDASATCFPIRIVGFKDVIGS